MVKIIAMRDLPYGGTRHARGTEFDATDRDAATLVAHGRACYSDATPDSFDTPVSAKPKKGRYRRRDMRAETMPGA